MRAVVVATLLIIPVHAEATAMLCKNPSRTYAASYSEDSRKFFADDTEYAPLLVENNAKRYVVSGLTVKDGPEFRAEFRPNKRIEFFNNGKLFQTDRCR